MKKIRKKMIFDIFIGLIFLLGIFKFYTTFSLGDEYRIESVVYQIKDGYIKGVSPYTDISLFIEYFELENCSIEVVDLQNQQITSGYVMNGSKTILYDNNRKILASYTNLVQGDYYADGKIDVDDFRYISQCLVVGCELKEYEKKSMDIDGDNEVHLNDVMLLDKAITEGYQGISLTKDSIVLQSEEKARVKVDVVPSYGLDQKVTWTSDNTDVVVIDDTGRLIGKKEGEAVVTVTTLDGKHTDTMKVVVDNTIQLYSYEGVGYVGGKDISVKIKSIDYEGITCLSANENISSCQIDGKNLIVKAVGEGRTDITVESPKYGKVTYQIQVFTVMLNVMPKYMCTSLGNVHFVTVSGFHTGELSFVIEDKEVVTDAHIEYYMNRNMVKITAGGKIGRSRVDIFESNGNKGSGIVVDTYRLSIPAIGGMGKVGEEMSTTIIAENVGELSCSSADETKATCRIEGNQLKVMPLAVGDVVITVSNTMSYNGYTDKCGDTTFLAVIREG